MSKNLTRPTSARPSVRNVIDDMLGTPTQPEAITELPMDRVHVIPGFNPRTAALTPEERDRAFSREALADLIASFTEVLDSGEMRGMLHPILVRPHGDGYAVVAGERRYYTNRYAGFPTIRVVVRTLTDQEALAAALIENAQREDIDPVSEAFAGFELLSVITGLDREDIVRHLSAIRKGREEDVHGLDSILRRVFGTGVTTWSLKRAPVFQLLPAERQAITSRALPAKVVFPLIKLGEDHAARAGLLQTLLAADPTPSSEDVQRMVAERMSAPAKTPLDPAATLRPMLSRVRKLKGDKAARAQELIQELVSLLK